MARSDFLMEDLNLKKQDSKIPQVFAGEIDGYYTVVDVNETGNGPGEYRIQIGAVLENMADHGEALRDEIINRFNPETVILNANQLVIAGTIPFRKNKYKERITNLIHYSVSELKALDIRTGDFVNGDYDETVSLYQIGQSYMYLSDQSYQEIQAEYEQQNNNPNAPQKSIQAGIGGALVGALIGGVIWAVLLYFGFYGWLAAVIGVHLAFKFYRDKNGLFTIPGVLTVLGLVLLTLILANYIVYAFILYQPLQEFGVSFPMVLLNLIPLLQDIQMVTPFIVDLVIGIGVAALYAGINTYRIYQTSKNEGLVRKI